MKIPGSFPTERYSSVVKCAGRDWLFTRHNVYPTHSEGILVKSKNGAWRTLFRTGNGSEGYGPYEVALPVDVRMSHNAAFRCRDDRYLVGYGGRDRSNFNGLENMLEK